jgi:hypothetical protein
LAEDEPRDSALPRRDGREITDQQFEEQFDLPAQPVLLTDLIYEWPLMGCTVEVLGATAGDQLVNVIDQNDNTTTTPLREFVEKVGD